MRLYKLGNKHRNYLWPDLDYIDLLDYGFYLNIKTYNVPRRNINVRAIIKLRRFEMVCLSLRVSQVALQFETR